MEHSVDYLHRDVALDALTVRGDGKTGAAYVKIGLAKNTWDQQQRAIDQMIEIRAMFLDEISIDYTFVLPETPRRESTSIDESRFVFAS